MENDKELRVLISKFLELKWNAFKYFLEVKDFDLSNMSEVDLIEKINEVLNIED